MKPSRPQSNPGVTEPLVPGTATAPAEEATQLFQGSDPTKPEQPSPAPAVPPSAPATKASKPTVLGDFRLLAKLGAGGMGTVYKALQISLDRPAALKVLSRDLAAKSNFIERFYREARVLARLDHPNLIRGYSVGEQNGFHYLAMEFVDGGSLQDWLKRLVRLSVGDAVHVILACALEHAHENGIIHRDIKPDNVLLTRKGVVKLADLGLAKALQEDLELTQSGIGAGTPHYIAPEQAANAKYADARSDIYSLGCMLYCLLAAEVPFKGESTLEVIKAKEAGKFTPLKRVNAEVPSRLELITEKMMASKPDHRYPNCTELIRDLEGLGLANRTLSFAGQLSGEVAAAPPSGVRRRDSSPPTQPTTAPIASAPTKPKAAAQLSQPSATEIGAGEEDRWFVTFTDAGGHIVTRNLGTLQVLRLIQDPHFDIHAQASRSLSGGFLPLIQYPPFQNAMRSRTSKEKADRKTAGMRGMYERLEQEEKKRLRFRWVHRLMATVSGWLGLLVWLAVLAAVGVGLFFLIRFLIQWGGGKLDSLWGS